MSVVFRFLPCALFSATLGLFINLFTPFMAVAEESLLKESENKKIQKNKKPLIIQSQVKGSQEQPNVIYIMPWQGVENPITINGNKRQIVLPQFKPINPKVFKAQVTRFHSQNSAVKVLEKHNPQ